MEDGDYDINLIDIWEMTIKSSQMASFPVSPALCGNLCVVHNSAPEAAFGARLPGEPWHAVRVPNAQAKGWVRSVQ